MIGSVSATAAATYATASRIPPQTDATPETSFPQNEGVTVALSPGATLLANLPSIILDPQVHLANAESRLNELRQELGISATTKIDIHLSSSGQFTVSGNDEKLAQLEQMLNDGTERELRNALIGAHSSAIIQRIAAASQETAAAVAANPGDAEALWTQMLAKAESIKSQAMDFSFANGTLNGVFSDGVSLAIA